MSIRKTLLVTNLALILVLGFSLAKALFWNYLPHKTFAQDPATDNKNLSSEPAPSLRPSQVNYDDILRRNLFNNADSSAQALVSPSGPRSQINTHNDWNLNLILQGTIAGPPSVARAIIEDPATKQISHYKIGATIAGARLLAIDENSVVFSCRGRKKVLNINTQTSPPQAEPKNDNQNSRVSATTALPVKNSQSRAQMRNEIVEDFLNHASIDTYLVKGQPDGLLIRDLDKVKAKDFLGLKNNDVIRMINGQKLTSKQKAFQVFKKARTQTNLEIEYLRDNKPNTLSFSMD